MNRIFITLDIVVPLMYTSLYYAVNIQYDGNPGNFTYQLNVLLICFFVCSALRGCLLLISAVLLGDALFRMRQAIAKVLVVQMLNQRIFVLHLMVLSLLVLSTFVAFIASTVQNVGRKPHSYHVQYDSLDACTAINFVQQIVLIVLFWNLGSKPAQSFSE